MSDMSMLINGLKVTAENHAMFSAAATRAPAASAADAVMAVEAAAEAFKSWSQTGPSDAAPCRRRPTPWKPAPMSSSRPWPRRPALPVCGPASTCTWPAAFREAAALTTQVAGEVIWSMPLAGDCGADRPAWWWALRRGNAPVILIAWPGMRW